MISTIFEIITVVLCISMFRIQSEHKVGILLFVSCCFNEVQVNFLPIHGAKILVCFAYLLSEIRNIKALIADAKQTRLYIVLIIALISFVVLCLFSPHIKESLTIFIGALLGELVCKYFVLFYAFWSLRSKEKIRIVIVYAIFSIVLLTIFGVENLIDNSSWFINEIAGYGQSNEYVMLGDRYETSIGNRFRVQSMFALACNYGHICTVLLFLFIYAYQENLIRPMAFYFSVAFCLFGITASGFRTCLITCVLAGFIYVSYSFEKSRRNKYLIVGLILFVLFYSFIPFVHEKVNIALSAFGLNDSTSGSSIEMRMTQLYAVVRHISDNVIFGRGFYFFNIDMGWAEGAKSTLVDMDLQGLESIILSLLLERGLFGLCCYFMIIWLIAKDALSGKFFDRTSCAFTLSVLTAYLFFSLMTGEQGSAFSSMLLLGIGLKLVYLNKS